MKSDLNKLTDLLIKLDKSAQEIDETVRDLRTKVHELVWELVEVKKKIQVLNKSHPKELQ